MSTKKAVPPGSPYDAFSYRELQAESKRRGLKAVAKKDELSKALFEDDKSPRKSLPKPSIPPVTPSALKTSYPPPTPPYDSSDSEDEEEEEETQEIKREDIKRETPTTTPTPKSPSKRATPKRTPTASPRYPTPLKTVPLSPEEIPRVPGWMLQLGVGLIFLLLVVLISGARSSTETQVAPTPSKQQVDSILRPVLSTYKSGDKILEKIKLHESGKALSMFLVGPTDKGLEIANDVAQIWPPYNSTKPLIVEKSDGSTNYQDIKIALHQNPELIIVVNTDKFDRDNSHFLGEFLDDTIAGPANRAVVILLGDLLKDNKEEFDLNDNSMSNILLKSRFIDRVVQRIRNLIQL